MASQWLHGEARKVIAQGRDILQVTGGVQVFLHFRRGELRASPFVDLAGFERVTRLSLPMDKQDDDLFEWMLHELKCIPCYPSSVKSG